MEATQIELRLLLEGGRTETLQIASDAKELSQLFKAVRSRSGDVDPDEQFFQLPLDGGRESLNFSSHQLVAFTTRPPVLVNFEKPEPIASVPAASIKVHRPPCMVIDNFLGQHELADILAYALKQEEDFDAGTVIKGEKMHRQNLVILGFANAAHSRLLCNRLLTWLPFILQKLGMTPFPVKQVESQLTASNDGHYYRAHRDAYKANADHRTLTCVYYFSKQPAQFTGGGLRIYDSRLQGGARSQAETFQLLQPRANRMVVFPSESFHELLPIRCPSGKFEDSRFAVTNWIWKQPAHDAGAAHGWGHLHCSRPHDQWFYSSGESP
ncbi:MAG: 2OG-Fe(II) oxygenase [Pseudomonadota bacterium]